MKKTHKEIVDTYLRTDIREEFMKCAHASDLDTDTIEHENVTVALALVINWALTWSGTPQGRQYWDDIHSSLMRGETTYVRGSYSSSNTDECLLLL